MYLDPTDSAYANLFNSGKIGMLVTGPWDLSGFPNVHYGVQIMPAYPGTSGGHQTISGPDNWVIFNNGATQVSAAEKFLLWLTAPAQVKYWSLHTGDLPTRASVGNAAGFNQQMDATLPGREHVRGQPGQREAGPAADPAVPEDLPGPRQHDRLGAAGQEPAAGRAELRGRSRSTRSWPRADHGPAGHRAAAPARPRRLAAARRAAAIGRPAGRPAAGTAAQGHRVGAVRRVGVRDARGGDHPAVRRGADRLVGGDVLPARPTCSRRARRSSG